mmetsp:Transcript_5210/g.11653  ORF Transcript_5210/g.11653 Transcript_5210/m.11653 type:complete len:345 (-) Transcript_5210:205-1239(-)
MSNAGPPRPGCAKPAKPAIEEKLDTAEGGFIALEADDEDFTSISMPMSSSSSDPSDPSPLSPFSSSSSESPMSSSESNISCDPSTGATRSSTANRSSKCSVEFSSSFSSSSLSSSSFAFALAAAVLSAAALPFFPLFPLAFPLAFSTSPPRSFMPISMESTTSGSIDLTVIFLALPLPRPLPLGFPPLLSSPSSPFSPSFSVALSPLPPLPLPLASAFDFRCLFAFGFESFESPSSSPSSPSAVNPLGLPFGMNPGDVGAWRSPAPHCPKEPIDSNPGPTSNEVESIRERLFELRSSKKFASPPGNIDKRREEFSGSKVITKGFVQRMCVLDTLRARPSLRGGL